MCTAGWMGVAYLTIMVRHRWVHTVYNCQAGTGHGKLLTTDDVFLKDTLQYV